MSKSCLAVWIMGVILVMNVKIVGAQDAVQASQRGAEQSRDATVQSTTTKPKQHSARRRRHASGSGSGASSSGSAPATAGATPRPAGQEAQEKVADQKLLEQQQVQSDRAAQINNQQVRAAQRQQDRLQNETRIEDAPGPAQTGVVPNAAPSTQPANTDVRIQDAPGPSETLPQPAQSSPSTPR